MARYSASYSDIQKLYNALAKQDSAYDITRSDIEKGLRESMKAKKEKNISKRLGLDKQKAIEKIDKLIQKFNIAIRMKKFDSASDILEEIKFNQMETPDYYLPYNFLETLRKHSKSLVKSSQREYEQEDQDFDDYNEDTYESSTQPSRSTKSRSTGFNTASSGLPSSRASDFQSARTPYSMPYEDEDRIMGYGRKSNKTQHKLSTLIKKSMNTMQSLK